MTAFRQAEFQMKFEVIGADTSCIWLNESTTFGKGQPIF
jgi:hypothetical protein